MVIDILREKHPEVTVPPDEHFDSYDAAEELLESMPVYCYAETVAKAAAKLRGTAGPCGVDVLAEGRTGSLGGLAEQWLA